MTQADLRCSGLSDAQRNGQPCVPNEAHGASKYAKKSYAQICSELKTRVLL